MALQDKSPTGDDVRPIRQRRRLRFALWAALAVLLIGGVALASGFLAFADRVADSRPPASPEADGIVALTGDAGRIEDAVALLDRGSADRLLISGVNERTSREELGDRGPRIARLISCCIDIGYEARDTRGNAVEVGKWARERGYGSLIVVTSAYHMPRSLAEIARVLPEVELVPYPVATEDGSSDWRSDARLFRLLVAEYLKYIVSSFA